MGIDWDFVGLAEPAWIDVPLFEELQAGPFFPSDKLQHTLSQYHAIPKSMEHLLPERIDCLKELQSYLQSLEVKSGLERWKDWLEKTSAAKIRFLLTLESILKDRWHEPEQLRAYHHDIQALQDHRWQSLILTEKRYYCPERSYYWGDYWLQSLDPCHRHLPHLHQRWQDLQVANQVQTPYLLWLEEHSSVGHEYWVRYLSLEEQQAVCIQVQEGKLTNSRGRLLSCPERQHFLFVIGLDQKLYASRAEIRLCHASFTRGQPVLASGVLQARDGSINHLKFESGHYISGPKDWWQAIQILRNLEIEFAEKTRVTVFDRFRYISTSISKRIMHEADQSPFLQALGLKPETN